MIATSIKRVPPVGQLDAGIRPQTAQRNFVKIKESRDYLLQCCPVAKCLLRLDWKLSKAV